MISQSESKNYVIFKNHSDKKMWEISGEEFTTYLFHDTIANEFLETMGLMLSLHGISDTISVSKMLIEYTQNMKEDMFFMEVA